jgi:hypothetical protein
MKNSFLMLVLCLLFSGSTFAIGEINITLYGKGGIVHTETVDKICPEPSDVVCTKMTICARDISAFEDGLIDAIPAVLDLGTTKAKILVKSMDQFEYSNNTVVVYESPELNAYKEWALGTASGVSFTWAEPVQLMPYREITNSDKDIQVIKIDIHGSGGVVRVDGKDKICPNKADQICATVEGDLWDLICLWWDSFKPNSEPVTVTTFENGAPAHSLKAVITGIEEGSKLEKNEGAYQTSGSTYQFKFVE